MRLSAFLMLCACSSGLDPHAAPWRRVTSAGPPARWGHAAVYDAAADRMLVFAGQSEAGERADVWSFDLASETWTRLATSPGPAPRVNPGAVLDAARNRMIVAAGRTGAATLFDDVWALDLSTLVWSELPRGPSGRQRPMYTSDHDHAWFYGGEGLLTVFGDLWELDLPTNAWSHMPNNGDAPASRTCGAMAVSQGVVTLNGGHNVATITDGTWRYEAQHWSRVKTNGGTAAGAHWAYATDTLCDTLYLAGGDHADNYDTAMTDELRLTGVPSFARVAVSALPDAHDHASLVFDAARRDLVLFVHPRATPSRS